MDKNSFLNMIKNLQSLMRCPSCSSVYEMEEMQFMGQGDGYFLLSMTCHHCSLPVWVNVFSGSQGNMPLTDLSVLDVGLIGKEPITKDEVIDFHRFLKGFDGNFKKLINRS